MARPMKCKRCGRLIMSTAMARTRSCGAGKTRKKDKSNICYGKMHEVSMEQYEREKK